VSVSWRASKAKAAGKYAGKGRPASIATEKVRDLRERGMGPSAIAKALGINRMSVHRILNLAAATS